MSFLIMPDDLKGDDGHKLLLGRLSLGIRKTSFPLGW